MGIHLHGWLINTCRQPHDLRYNSNSPFPMTASDTDNRLLKCCVFNGQSIVNKLYELRFLLHTNSYDCVFITETWLTDDISNGLLDPHSEYTIIRTDRKSRKGGGVCVLINKKHNVIPVQLANEYADLELLAIDFLSVLPKVRVFVVYRPPYYDLKAVLYTEIMIDCLTRYSCGNRCHIIVGDLNTPKMDWENATGPSDSVNKPILDFVVKYGYCQLVNFATRGRNTLDVVLTDSDLIVSSISCEPPLGQSDHNIIEFIMSLCMSSVKGAASHQFHKRYLWRDADYEEMNSYLNTVDWSNVICQNPGVEQMWDAFVCILWNVIDMFVPSHKFRT